MALAQRNDMGLAGFHRLEARRISEENHADPYNAYIRGYRIEDIPWPFQDAMRRLVRYERILPRITEAEEMHELFRTGLNPGRVRELERLYREKCREARMLRENDGWILPSDSLPEVPDDVPESRLSDYIVTVKGAEESSILKYVGDGMWVDKWGETHEVAAWKPFPHAYRGSKG